MARTKTLLVLFLLILVGCGRVHEHTLREGARARAETESVPGKADEVGIWVNRHEPIRSVIIGNDKSHMGALYVYDLQGKFVHRSPYLNRPVGVSIRYDIPLSNGKVVDVVACGIRSTNEIKVFSIDPATRELTDITTEEGISSGFERDTYGLCLYKRASDGKLFAFVSRKETDDLHQVLLEDDGKGKLKGTLIRKFGKKDQKSFVEGMVADDEYGYLYCSDEQNAILKYYADPTIQKDPFIQSFGVADGIRGDREGLALYKMSKGQGYLIVSSQGDSTFKIYQRAGKNKFVKTAVAHDVWKTDGIAVTAQSIPPYYPTGVFVAHNDKKNNFVIFDWYSFSRLKP
ncbi:MAG: phytase [Chlamydiales bacterium]|nr:phytase [Chlamydiia bacterium]MCP5505070.1 phytase [Chlamydiales bacterium]